MIMSIFAIILISIVIVLMIPNIAEPTMGTYGTKQAHILARNLASEINALALSEAGEIKRTFEGEWDIFIFENKITVNHLDFKASEDLLVNVKDAKIIDAKRVLITKIGDFIEVKKA